MKTPIALLCLFVTGVLWGVALTAGLSKACVHPALTEKPSAGSENPFHSTD